MTHPSMLDLLTMIQAARHSRGADQERHLARAENTCRAMLASQPPVCILDGEPCPEACTLAPQGGMCGRTGR